MSKQTSKSRLKGPATTSNATAELKEAIPNVKDKAFSYLLDSALLIFFLYYFYKIYSFLGETYFWADENVHAYVSSVILKTHQIPFVLPPEIYGMREFSYPPLFHVLSALAMSVAGFSVLKYINLTLLIFFLFGFYSLIRRYYGNYEASIACLLLSLSSVMAINTIRYMTEMLSMVLIFFSFFFVLLALKKSKKSFAIIAGVSTGLLLLTKQIGVVVLSFYFVLFVWFLLIKAKDARIMLIVVGVSVCIYIPYLILTIYNNVDVFKFVSLWLGDIEEKPKWTIEAVRSFRRYDSSLKEFAYLFFKGNGIIMSISFLFPLYYFIKVRAKEPPQHYVFVMLICLSGAMIAWHITNPRHTITLLPLITFLIGYSFTRIARKTIIIKAAILLLFIIACYSVYHMPNYRHRYNFPKDYRTLLEMIREDDSIEGRIFCIDSFDTLMYTGKPVIWPHPKLRHIPVDLVEAQDAKEFYSLLKKYQIKTILINKKFVRGNTYVGRNYPLYFFNNCLALNNEGRLTTIAYSEKHLLIKVNY